MLRSIIPYKYTKAKKVFAIFPFVRREEFPVLIFLAFCISVSFL